jgi:carboxyl-terminal processing protease
VELGLVDGYFTVVSPIHGTPADRAGLEPGDRIVAVDGEPLRGRRLIEVIADLRGESGSAVQLRLLRDERDSPFEVELIREEIQVASVESRLLEPGYGYVRIAQFQADTGRDFQAALKALERSNAASLDGLVLDLRNNPGGVLLASVDVADSLLEKGMIVYTEGRLPSSHLKYRASGRDALNGAPIVVLINAGSASASEIVAGALQDHGRATLIGSRSYGKGSVQSLMPLAGDQAIKLTTAYYYTPNGRSIHHKGIEPDVPIDTPADPAVDGETAMLDTALQVLKSATMTARL